ncbi:MAG: ATP-dependent zinc metalloprotease FtsH, partial [Metamycoplasmataceae bacterium]
MNENKKSNTPKKKNLFLIVSIIILIALFGFFLFNVFNTTGTKLSLSEFWIKYNAAALSTDDGIYFSSITVIDYQRLMEVVFVENINGVTTTNTYLVGLTSAESPLTDIQWQRAIENGLGPNGVYQGKAVEQENVFVQFLFSFGPILLLLIVSFFIYRSQMKGSGGGMFNPGKNQAEKIKSNKKFSDIAGNIEVKEEVSELVDYLKNPKKYSNVGARIPKGILLGGPP